MDKGYEMSLARMELKIEQLESELAQTKDMLRVAEEGIKDSMMNKRRIDVLFKLRCTIKIIESIKQSRQGGV